MCVPPIAGVDHMNVRRVRARMPRDQVRRAAGRMPHHEHIGLHRRQVVDRIEQRLAFGRARTHDIEVEHVGGQAPRRDLERRARACAVFEKQVEHALAAQQRHIFHFALGNVDEAVGRAQDAFDHHARQAVDGEQVMQLAFAVELRIAAAIQHRAPLASDAGGHHRRASAPR